jgi:hypothetical protein
MKTHFSKIAAVFMVIVTMLSLFTISVSAASVDVWDGKTYTEPTISGEYLVIDSAEDLAWVLKNQNTKGLAKVKLTVSVDMAGKTLKSFPATITEFNGGKKTISNWVVSGNGAFATTTTGIKVSYLTLDNIKVSNSSSSGGIIGVVYGNSTFTSCNVKNSTITSTGNNAGGLVGYIGRQTKTDRATKISVTFNKCTISNTTISAKKAEGIMLGLLSGYDNGESVNFKSCSATNTKVADFKSMYVSANQSCFLTAPDAKYDGFVGDETYRRGKVNFESKRFQPKWDGKTTVTPMLADPTYDSGTTSGSSNYVIYSAFDLAGLRAKTATPNALYLKTDLDMNGQGADGKYNVPSVFSKSKYTSKDDNNFNPFTRIATLDGGKKTIYNLAITQLEKESGAFILTATGTTVHKNIKFNNCQTVATHKAVKTDAKAYGAILCANAGGSNYTMSGVTATNCRVFALQKVGTLAGRVGATKSSLKSNTVDGCYVENYKCTISETFDSGNKTFGGRTVRVKATFYPHGEVGGMYGFVQGNATISKCAVKNTTVHALGQADKMATVTGSTLGKAAIKAAGYYLVPGRHVSTFIGDIRVNGNTVKVSGCTVENSKCTWTNNKHNGTYTSIGQAYYVEFLDKIGTVSVDGKKLVLADCNKYTTR